MGDDDESRVRISHQGKVVYDFMIKDIGGEAIMKVAVPRTDAHLSFYPKGDCVRHHVTHEAYPKGHGRRHTQKKEVDLLRMVNAILQMISPSDDPPPQIVSLSEVGSKKLEEWAQRVFPRVFHPPTDRIIKRFKGSLADFYDTILQPSGSEVVMDFDPLLEIADDMNEDDLIETIKENELSRPGKFWGFSEDFSKFVVSLDSNTVAEFDAESIGRFQEVIMEEMGFAGYLRTIDRKLAGRK